MDTHLEEKTYIAGRTSPSISTATERLYALEQMEAQVWESFIRQASSEEAAACGVHLTQVGSGLLMAARRIDILFFNRLLGLGLGTPATEGMIDEIIAAYTDAGVSRFFVQVSPVAIPSGLTHWLRGRGFRHYNNWVKLWRDTAAPPDVETDLRIEPLGVEQADQFARMVAPAFDWPDVVHPWLARLVGSPGWRHYMAYDGDVPVATGALFVAHGVGYLGPAVTLPAHRRRGAQGALITRRIRDAAALGCTLLVTETAEERPARPAPSFRNMIRYGFQVAYARPNYLFEGTTLLQ